MRKLLRSIVNAFGYDIHRLRPIDRAGGFELYRYRRADGTFDYDKYKAIQVAGNKGKLGKVWVVKENIAFLADYITQHVDSVSFGLCHGTRRGKEQEWFKEYLKCDVIGTEISETAAQFPNTIQWDFHDVKPEWIDAVDFIYSNAFDHSYDPEKCLVAWMSCIRKGGICMIEHTSGHEEANELDPFGADVSVMPFLILQWGKSRFCVREILDAPSKPDSLSYVQYLIIQRL